MPCVEWHAHIMYNVCTHIIFQTPPANSLVKNVDGEKIRNVDIYLTVSRAECNVTDIQCMSYGGVQ